MKQPVRKAVAKANNLQEDSIYTLLVDGNNLLKISSVRKSLNQSGNEIGAIPVFMKKLGDILKKKDFNYCVICWDGEGSGVLRWQIYKDYKANRDKNYWRHDPNLTDYDRKLLEYERRVLSHRKAVSQEDIDNENFQKQKILLQDMLDNLGLRQYEYKNVEGDDLIAYYVKNKKANEKVIIMSTDKDLTQLIGENVAVWNCTENYFITEDNSVEHLGVRSDNIVTAKIICGDTSDNIKGIKGAGFTSLVKNFPELASRKVSVEDIIEMAMEKSELRKLDKKKPLMLLENIKDCVTTGIQGKDLYSINKQIIDLSEPLLTSEAKESLEEETYAPLDMSERGMKEVYKFIKKNDIRDLQDEERFGDLLGPFSRILMMENKRYDEWSKSK